MSEEQQRFGDGQDNYLQGAQKGMQAAKQAAAVGKTAEAGANAAAATVQGSVETGKAAANIAAGAAAGGPWGAILSAAWAMRNTLFKIVVFLCLFLSVLIVLIVSLPSIVTNNVFRTDPATVDLNAPTDLVGNVDDVSATITSCVQAGYDAALSRVSAIIADGGYDQELSMQALVNYGLQSSDYDICYTLAAYSASLEQRGTSKADLEAKLLAVADQMFPVTYTTATATVTSTVTTEAGTQVVEFQVTYAICTIHPFDQSVILTAFNLDTDAIYNQFQITTGEAILNMSNALKMTMYGSLENGMVPPITDAELNAYLASLTCSETRKELMRVALSLVGRVPYIWGGKSPPGWNEAWNTPRLVTSAGSSSTGTLRPYGLDCSGYTDWVYKTALGVTLYEGSRTQWDNSYAITEAELLPGDLGFMAVPGTVPVNHVLLYAGKDANIDVLQEWIWKPSSLLHRKEAPDMSDDREFSNIYTIPPNYTDSGKLMGGMLETRNTVEAGILLVLVGYPEVKWLPVDLTTKIVIMTVTLIPLGVFALMGIGGDSLLQYVTHMIRFWHRRRKLHFKRIGYRHGKSKLQKSNTPAQKGQTKASRPVRAGLHSTQKHTKRHR